MKMENISLVIPTIRLRDVPTTIKEYRSNLQRYGHDIPIIVFDDSNKDQYKRDFNGLLSHNFKDTFYVGPDEKEEFKKMLTEKVGLAYEETIRKTLRPCYGGNRNFTILYTLGDLFVSVDDDMKPYGYVSKETEDLCEGVVLKGIYIDKKNLESETRKIETDLLSAYLEILGKNVGDVPENYAVGRTLNDSMTYLFTNKTKGGFEPNEISVGKGKIGKNTRIVTAQTFRSGSADVDAVDYAEDFMITPENAFINDMSLLYVIKGYKPCVTKTNWRLDCGISGYDNREGLPPFFPTKLRFEDYVFRLWLQQDGLASAHVNAIQTHKKNPYNRATLPYDLWNEDIANWLKDKFRENLREIGRLNLLFDGKFSICEDDAKKMLERGKYYLEKAIKRANECLADQGMSDKKKVMTCRYYTGFVDDIVRTYKSFDEESFIGNVRSTIKNEVKTTKDTMKIWPSLVEIASEIKNSGKLPVRRLW